MKRLSLLILCFGLLLPACQGKADVDNHGSGLDAILNENEDGSTNGSTSEDMEYETPHSNGPTSAPDPSLLTPAKQ